MVGNGNQQPLPEMVPPLGTRADVPDCLESELASALGALRPHALQRGT